MLSPLECRNVCCRVFCFVFPFFACCCSFVIVFNCNYRRHAVYYVCVSFDIFIVTFFFCCGMLDYGILSHFFIPSAKY